MLLTRRTLGLGLLATPMLARIARAEAGSIRLGKQYGLPFLPQMVMESQTPDRKNTPRPPASPNLKVEWASLSGPRRPERGPPQRLHGVRQRRPPGPRNSLGTHQPHPARDQGPLRCPVHALRADDPEPPPSIPSSISAPTTASPFPPRKSPSRP